MIRFLLLYEEFNVSYWGLNFTNVTQSIEERGATNEIKERKSV